MLEAKLMTRESPLLPRVQQLYNAAFPPNELIPFPLLLPDGGREGAEMVAFTQEGEFCGFISLLTLGDITHILYFAMEEYLRGQGLGGQALEMVNSMKKGQRIIADLEKADAHTLNYAQRQRRCSFYQRHGYRDSGVGYIWCGETYSIYLRGQDLTEDEFWAFWKHYMK